VVDIVAKVAFGKLPAGFFILSSRSASSRVILLPPQIRMSLVPLRITARTGADRGYLPPFARSRFFEAPTNQEGVIPDLLKA
jgi:hypothetical protein